MQIEHKYLEVYIESDGSLSARNTVNVFQYSNDYSGVKMFCPYGHDEVMPYISVQLYNGTVLEERTMGYSNTEVDNGRTWYAYTYLFPETVTRLAGMRYSTSIYLAFRFEDIVNGRHCLLWRQRPRSRLQFSRHYVDRGEFWYAKLTNEQKEELQEWYQAWLDVTDTKEIPEKPTWLN